MVAAEIPAVVAEAQRAGSTKGNPIALTHDELAEVLRRRCERGASRAKRGCA
jgi:hypothetical protein